jgi:tetratricopeptide (TPR) repeat protein
MDFLDFDGQDLYFDDPISIEVKGLLEKAANAYPDESAEYYLMKSYFLEPNHLMVLVALYRYFYYQHRYEDALIVADRSLRAAADKLNIQPDWQNLKPAHLGSGVFVSMGLTRFYLLGLKARAYLQLRLNDLDGAIECLSKLKELDPKDQFGSAFLMKAARQERGDFMRLVHGR